MLDKRLVPIAFREGLDTKTSQENGVPGRLMDLRNGVFGKIGQIRKRFGYDRLSSDIEGGAALGECSALATYKDELLSFSGGRLYSWSDAAGSWLDRGACQTADLTETSVIHNSYAQTDPVIATADGLACVAWEDSRGGIRYSIFDIDSGAHFVADTQLSATGTRPFIVAFNGEFVAFYAFGNNIFYRRIDLTAPTVLGPENYPISTLDPTNMVFDIAVVGSRVYIVWGRTAGTSLAYFDTSLALNSVTTSLQTSNVVALWGDPSDNVWAYTSAIGSQKLAVYDSANAAVLAETSVGTSATVVVASGVYPQGATRSTLVLIDVDSVPNVNTYALTIGGSVSTLGLIKGGLIHGRPFGYLGTAYIPIQYRYGSTLQATTFVIDENCRVVAKGAYGATGNRGRPILGAIGTPSDGMFTFASPVKTALKSTSGGLFSRLGVGLVTVDLRQSSRFQSAEIGNTLLISGGVVNSYDGVTLAESGFHLFPEGTTASVGAGGGGLDIGEVYRWKVIYEWTDAYGQVHRSAPGAVTISGASSYTSAAGSETVTLTIPTLTLTSKTGVRIVVYRTEGNGSIYYRLSPIASPTLNVTTAATVTFVDTYADAAITANELLYTDGAAGSPLENIAPSASSDVCTHQGRAFLVSGPNKISFSQIVDEGDPPAFNDALYIIPDARGGDIVALASMDDKLVIFKESAVFVTSGPGPDDRGAGAFPAPQLVTTDVGCREADSVVAMSAGLMFKSAKGIYILDRSLSVTYIGAPVEDYNDLAITSATLVAAQNQVRFTTRGTVYVGADALNDVAIVYDYAFNQWSVFTNCGGVDSTVWDGAYTYAKPNGKTYVEAPDRHDDDGAFVKLKLTTSWLSFAGVQGYQRVYRVFILGEYKSDHSMRVQLGYDFQPQFTYDQELDAETIIAPGSWGSSATWGSGSFWGGAAPVEWFVAKPERQKCSSIRVSIEDSMDARAEDELYGAGFSISNLALLVGVKRGGNKLPASRVT